MSTLNYILSFTFLGSIGGLIGGLFLLIGKNYALHLSNYLAPFAAGVLLSVAFLELLPEASHEAGVLGINIFGWTLGGILLFFIIEIFIHWFHHHEKIHEEEREGQSIIPLIVIGDTIHNFIDGVVIAATFSADISLGMITSLAVFAHEVPQEIADFSLLLHRGVSSLKTLAINFFSALAAFLGAIGTYFLGGFLDTYLPVAVAITAGFFIYIATSDLIPEIHDEKNRSQAFVKGLLLLWGVIVMLGVIVIFKEIH
jgi:zinc and cadmium transporter